MVELKRQQPKFLQLGTRAWVAPTVSITWLEREKLRLEVEAKKRLQKEIAQEAKAAATDANRQEIVDTGRLPQKSELEEKKHRLELEIAVLELRKQASLTPADKRKIAEAEVAARVEAEPVARAEKVAEESESIALKALELKEKELEEKQKKHAEDMKAAAEKYRRELLEYKHSLGLPNHPFVNGFRPPATDASQGWGGGRPSLNTMRVMDDPRFGQLSAEDQQTLVGMTIEQQWDEGWGPYPASAEDIGVAGKSHSAAAHAKATRKTGQLPVEGQQPKFDPAAIQDNFVTLFMDEPLPAHLRIVRRWPPKTCKLPEVLAAPVAVDQLDDAQMQEIEEQMDAEFLPFAVSDLIEAADQLGANGLLKVQRQLPVSAGADGSTMCHVEVRGEPVLLAPVPAQQQQAANPAAAWGQQQQQQPAWGASQAGGGTADDFLAGFGGPVGGGGGVGWGAAGAGAGGGAGAWGGAGAGGGGGWGM